MWKCQNAVIALGLLVAFGLAPRVVAGWPPEGLSICEQPGDQVASQLTTDCAGGAIVAWQDARSDTLGIYAQRLTSTGEALWTAGGKKIVTAEGDSLRPCVTSDGVGGAHIVWHDARAAHYNVYVQRIDADGNPQWNVDGVAVCEAVGDQVEAQIVGDDAGGAIVVWLDGRDGFAHLYGQRFDAQGIMLWQADGLPLCTGTTGDQGWHNAIADGNGGVIVTWMDWRYEAAEHGDIFAQKLTGAGIQGWGDGGMAVCTAGNMQRYPELVSDGDGGAIITWADYRAGDQGDIYAQRIQERGVIPSGRGHVWPVDGAVVCDSNGKQRTPKLASDGVGGAIITWMDNRADTTEYDIFATRINEFGSTVWPDADGTPIDLAAGVEQKLPHVIPDAEGGGIIVWREGEPGFYDLYAQRIPADGTPPAVDPTWGVDRYGLCTFSGSQLRPQFLPTGMVAAAGIGAAIAVWEDRRDEEGSGCDVFASMLPRISATDVDWESGPARAAKLVDTHPNPFNPRTRIVLEITEDVPVQLTVYDVAGRRIRVLLHGLSIDPGRHEIEWDGRDSDGARVAAGVYFCRLKAGGWCEAGRMVLVK